jgi:hypothetical protein
MTDWVTTTAQAATAAGTLILAVATFVSVRAGQRAARATEAALLAGIRPILVASRPDDPVQKIGFMDEHWVRVEGGQGVAEVVEGVIYLALSVRNAGNGVAVLDRWNLVPERRTDDFSPDEIPEFRRLTRDIYIPAGEAGFWQGAIRDRDDPHFAPLESAIAGRRPLTVDLLYGDQEGGQRTVSRFLFQPVSEGRWLGTVGRHWNLDRPNPR